jgi:2-deoxy-D-gluconate 3-dehydrogenase
MAVNLKAPFMMAQAIGKIMIKNGGGKIVNIASSGAVIALDKHVAYCASKGGVVLMTQVLALEWAEYNINVNAIAPGYMVTNNTKALRADEERNKAILDRIPAGRWGLPEDLQGPALLLASSASDYMNGYTVAVDGGWLAR